MDKTESKYRDIQFYSGKNEALMSVHSRDAKVYADLLEASPHVMKYKCIVPLEPGFMEEVSRLGIRPEYFDITWASDIWIENADGTTGIREVVPAVQLVKRATIEKLELSRRYWKQLDVDDWKVVVMDRGGVEDVL